LFSSRRIRNSGWQNFGTANPAHSDRICSLVHNSALMSATKQPLVTICMAFGRTRCFFPRTAKFTASHTFPTARCWRQMFWGGRRRRWWHFLSLAGGVVSVGAPSGAAQAKSHSKHTTGAIKLLRDIIKNKRQDVLLL
jgi:hypothetical protein